MAIEAKRLEQQSKAKIEKNIGNIATSAVKLNELIHETGIACMEHAKDYGDTDLAARLVDAMPKSHRRGLLIRWFGAFSPVTIAKNPKTDRMKGHLKGKIEERVWNIEAAKATPFYAMPEAQNEPDVPTLESIAKNVLSFFARMEKAADKIVNDNEKAHTKKVIADLKLVATKDLSKDAPNVVQLQQERERNEQAANQQEQEAGARKPARNRNRAAAAA